ncbi:MAG: Gfo/Idh/MocA family oxidoreductase [Alphaproteobacteria bacterium]|nr:Gfo/Idh/MocA family oxidoreductase [Alphaproteobacteria bacterium]MDE2113108.1 Gfo/Idh/MocA family oxidoreductase [Alphaproteobacteria bacterium]MDE2495228.1 Gfo/Idh/MocA family oxidoreductase [Alphaproteobacteria bacterium]
MPEKKTVNVAVIGCGRVVGHHLRSIDQVEGGRIIAVCDIVPERAEAYAKQYDVAAFTNYHEMIRTIPEIDVVAIVTPSGMHAEHALDVMRHYGKHILVEKPTFMHTKQLFEAYDFAEANGLRIYPVFQNRHNKAVQRVKQAIDGGELGDIRIMAVRVRWCRPTRYYNLAPWRGTYSHDGGALSNQGIHHIDLLRYLGGEVQELSAVLRTLGAEIEVEDAAVATLKYASNALGVVEVTTAARPDDFEASLSIVGGKGLAQLGGLAVNELQVFTPDPAACAQASERIPDAYGFGHITVYRNLVADMRGERPFPVDRQDCLNTLNLLHAFYRSDEINGWVNVWAGRPSNRLGRPNAKISNLYRTPAPESSAS